MGDAKRRKSIEQVIAKAKFDGKILPLMPNPDPKTTIVTCLISIVNLANEVYEVKLSMLERQQILSKLMTMTGGKLNTKLIGHIKTQPTKPPAADGTACADDTQERKPTILGPDGMPAEAKKAHEPAPELEPKEE